MSLFLRTVWWRIRYAVWYVGWRIIRATATWRTMHGVKVGLAPQLDHQLGIEALNRVEAAFALIARYAPRRLSRISRDIRFFWVRRAAYAPAYFIQSTKVCVLDRTFLTAPDTTPALITAALIHEATHARLESAGIKYSESARARIEAICDAQSAEFALRLPDGGALHRRIIDGRPADATYWSDQNLDRRVIEARVAELEATRQEVEQADLPIWLKNLLRRVIRSRAA